MTALRRFLVAAVFASACLLPAAAVAAPDDHCGGLFNPCGSLGADPSAHDFRGLIAISHDPPFLESERSLAARDGCADCVWVLYEDCQTNIPGGHQVDCRSAHNNPACRKGQLAERVFLSRPGHGYGMVGVYCLGKGNRIIPLGQIAKADVDRYLKDVRPPDLEIRFDPGTSLAGLATHITARPDSTLRPVPFGGQGVTETIRLNATRQDWNFGDGQTATFTDASVHTSHTYAAGGHLRATVRTSWGATYTITYQGITLGPYDATGHITGRQTRPVTVVTSTPVLVSHG
jgi:hypothetical protein